MAHGHNMDKSDTGNKSKNVFRSEILSAVN